MVSKEEAEDLGLEKSVDTRSPVCIICGWPINRILDLEVFLPKIVEWIKKNAEPVKCTKILRRLEFLSKVKELAICRYDFFYLIKDLISEFDEKLGEKFEKEIASQYEFGGSLIS